MNLYPYDGRPGIAADILAYFKRANNKFVPSREISESLNINRQLVYENVAYLRDCGYQIEAGRNKGYKLVHSPDVVLPLEVAAGLSCRFFACRIFSYETIGSTNKTAHYFAKTGLPEGTLIIANTQSKGRGRLGRKWHSPAGKGLYFSLILRPKLPPDKTPGLSLTAGLAIIRAIYTTLNLKTQMKWPNDILYNRRKLAGILIELAAELDRVEYVVVGIGINVNHIKKDFPRPLHRTATSLKIITKKEVSRISLLQNILVQFEKLYGNFCRHGFKYIASELNQHSAVLGKRVTLSLGKKKITGKVIGFDDNGGLLIKNRSGLKSYTAGEITLR
ncbi:MAG: biotin--[acetyl-CoA-carboxylase] ligase [candidate division Zixibacteria bacterium 4484_95]|nr:MAG: biotin--[acetyl-CoA-carboxylase] ligase [candidate division Zixibacteria bacterium 4484_95]